MGKNLARKKKQRIEPSTSPAAPPSNQRRKLVRAVSLSVLALGLVWVVWAVAQDGEPTVSDFTVINTYPHDPKAFSQGLVYEDNVLYEGTGQYGQSELREVDLKSGQVKRSLALDRRYFGEGITVWKDKIIQLTWKSNIAFVYDKKTFQEVDRFRVPGQGWGLTTDGKHLILSDGTATLRFLDPDTYQLVRRVSVTNKRRRLSKLNELEYINGEIYANIWYEDIIARISPTTGKVVGWVDLRSLNPGRADKEHVMNGIAYDPQTGNLFVTGKNWSSLFEIRLKPR